MSAQPSNSSPTRHGRRSLRVPLSLFPEHDAIIRTFAEETHRTYSNAAQFIIEDWVRLKRAALGAAEPNA